VILVVAAVLCVATVPLAGGRLSRLLEIELRATWTALAALALQLLITTVAPTGAQVPHEALHLASYALAAAFLFVNRHVAGMAILAAGAALNLTAICANHGVMPASARAMHLAGLHVDSDFANSAPVTHPRLLALGDTIPVPGPWPLGNVVSIGDLAIMVGLAIILHRACRPTGATGPTPQAASDT
jgi:Family of unknown function (DUF5317)